MSAPAPWPVTDGARIAELEARIAGLEAALAEKARSEARLHMLAEASRRFAEGPDQDTLLQTIVRYIADTIGDLCVVRLLAPDAAHLLPGYAAHPDPTSQSLIEPFRRHTYPLDDLPTGQVIRSGVPLLYAQLTPEAIQAMLTPDHRPYLEQFGISSIVIVPILVRGCAIGAMNLLRMAGGVPYTNDDMAMLQDLADRAGLALENARLSTTMAEAHQAKESAFTLLDSVFATAPVGLAFLDTNLRYIRVNQALADLDGLPVAAYPGRTPFELLPELAAVLEPVFRQVLTSGVAVLDREIHTATGTNSAAPRDWLASYYPVYGHNGTIAGIAAVVVEITRRKRDEEALRAHAELQAMLLETVGSGVIAADTAGCILLCNAAARQLFGLAEMPATLEELVRPGTFYEADGTTVLAIGEQPLARSLRGEATDDIELLLRRSGTGEEVWMLVRGRPLYTSAGQLRGGVIGCRDITQSRRDEAARRESEARFRQFAEHAPDLIYRYRLHPAPGFEYVSPSATALTGYTPAEHYADPQLGFKLVHPDDRELLQRMAEGDMVASQPLALRWIRKDGMTIWTEQRTWLANDTEGWPVAIEGIVRDISERKRAEERMRAALVAEQQTRLAAEQGALRISRLQAVTAALAGTLTLDEVARVITDHGINTTGSDAIIILLLDATGTQLELLAHSGHSQEIMQRYRTLALSELQPPTVAVCNRTPIWVRSRDDAEARFPGMGAIMELAGHHAQATLPLITGGRVSGAVSFCFCEPEMFPEAERAFLLNLAQQCAQALERGRLYGEVQSARERLQSLSQHLLMAQEQERRHIARELHDEVGQVLGALKINLHVLNTQPGASGCDPRIAESLAMLDQLIAQVRALSLDLRPALLDDLGLAAALEWYTGRLAQRSGLDVHFYDGLGGWAVPPSIATACFRIAQEALTNVLRHAQAHSVSVALGQQDGMLTLTVHDDGVGFDVAAQRARAIGGASLGLLSMTERAELAGGWADISSSDGNGSEVWAWFPLGEEV